jgi:hypothetical protein
LTNRPAIGWRRVAAIVALALAGIVIAVEPKPAAPVSINGGPYGSAIGADSLANTQVGGPSCGCTNDLVSYRFRAGTSARLDSLRIYVIANGNTGYSNGTGGSIEVAIEADDGTLTHGPSGTKLASTTVTPGNPGEEFPLIAFSAPASLTAGQLYHVVFRNADPAPLQNFISVDGMFTFGARLVPQQPRASDADWGQLVNPGTGWQLQPNYTPILQLNYDNGVKDGMGYIESWINSPKAISGAAAARETFTRTGPETSVGSAWIRLLRVSGESPLSVRLETASGALVQSASIPADSIPLGAPDAGQGSAWANARFPRAASLAPGQAYQLVLGAPTDTVYSIFSLERGNNYDFAPTTYFSDGYGQYTTDGTSWLGFDQPGGRVDNSNSDLQFYFGN